eukprot:12270037-Ditylum_brightwellii.AAC.1
MDPYEYAHYWKSIGDAKMPNDFQVSSGCTPFWKEVKDAVNELLKELFTINFDDSMAIVIDDDKMHYQIGTEDPGVPKTTQHTRDN